MTVTRLLVVCIAGAILMGSGLPARPAVSASVIAHPPVAGSSSYYTFNRKPLLADPLAKLPIGAIRPDGWLEHELLLMAHGMTGRLDDVSHFLAPDSGWLDPSKPGWEEVPYWLKGFGDLGYVLGDPRIKGEAMFWLDAIFKSQQPDGYFGPRENKANDDLWPNMLVLNAMESLYDATGDSRVIPFLTRYFQYENSLPADKLFPGSWQKVRAGDNLESVYWLYNRTRHPWLLDLAKKIHEHTVDWAGGIASYHGVNFTQGFREPAEYYQQALDPKYLHDTEALRHEMMSVYGQVPGGTFAADENCRPGKTGPEQGFETCSIVEYMHSYEMLLRITGDPLYADRCEEVAFNALPAAMTPDLTGLHYLTAPNQVQLDKGGDHCYQNGGRLVSYSATEVYRCCQHNVAMGWPYYAENLWMATRDHGVAAVIYTASQTKVKVGGGESVRIKEDTRYPFADTIRFTVSAARPVTFPLYLRVPGWCQGASVRVNGRKVQVRSRPLSYIALKREWADGDRVELTLPMRIRVVRWAKQNNAISVARGPLWYSLKIGEQWKPFVEDPKYRNWPDYEVFPTTPWNYALVVDSKDPARSFQVASVSNRKGDANPYTLAGVPVELKAHARRLPEWKLVMKSPGPLPLSPVTTNEPEQEVTLIPMGAARLRISVFPTTEK